MKAEDYLFSIMRSNKVIQWLGEDLWRRRNFADPGSGGDVDMPLEAMKAMKAMKAMNK